MKLKLITVLSVALLSTNAHAYNEEKCKIFTEEQRETMQKAFQAGAEKDYSWTLAALTWQETSAGKYPVNWKDPSFGPFQNNIRTVAKRYGAKNSVEEFALAERLMTDFEFAAGAAMAELEYWDNYHKGDYKKMLASYNNGWAWESERAQKYKDDVIAKLKYLKENECLFDDNRVKSSNSTANK